MTDTILVLNSGSSSIKFSLFEANEDLTRLARGALTGIGGQSRLLAEDISRNRTSEQQLGDNLSHQQGLAAMIGWCRKQNVDRNIAAIGHRVVHGGNQFIEPVVINNERLDELEKVIPLAPLHQPHNIAGIRACAELFPDAVQVGCFDTAFHAGQSAYEKNFALPRKLTEGGIHRYGFHGLSYEYIATVLAKRLDNFTQSRVIVAHLGNGASLCAMRGGKSIATTMGFTALDGLPMGTRCGALDPGVVLYLLEALDMDAEAITDLLYHQSGLLGVSGISNNMSTLLASAAPEAREAIELFTYCIAREIGSLTAALEGLDALVFTAGIGENSALIRERVCQLSQWLGILIDKDSNANVAKRLESSNAETISDHQSEVSVWVIPTDEEWVVARHTLPLI